MPREKDSRDFKKPSQKAIQPAADLAFESVAGPNIESARVNPISGSPATVKVNDSPVSAGSLIDRALEFMQGDSRAAAGFGPKDKSDFVPDPHVQHTKGGAAIVHLHQRYRGIPVFQMSRSVQFSAGQQIDRVVGDSTSIAQEVDIIPKIDAPSAVLVAARYLASTNTSEPVVDHWGGSAAPSQFSVPADYQPQVLARFENPSQPTTIAQGPFGDEIKASLTLFDQGQQMRLAWKLLITMPEYEGQYLMLIAADHPVAADRLPVDSLVLYCKNVMHTAVKANVFTHNPGISGRKVVEFPLTSLAYPLSGGILPSPFPQKWWVENDLTAGNCTVAVSGFGTTSFQGTSNGSGDIVFNPAQDQGDDQKIVNIFYFCNFMHDFLYMLGFDEEAGNFQAENFSGRGTASDAVTARAHPGPVRGTANMLTPVDGENPTMNMGLVASTKRHTAFDSDVVFHEYCHGLSNRLVGGRVNDQALVEPQSSGMGEGWSDYFALTIQNHGNAVEKTVTGDWVVNSKAGIRMHPYDKNYPGKFGDVGTPPYDDDEHAIGEIWCAALMQMNRNLGQALGSADKGHELGWQIVVDGMKLTPANPSFLDARDGILQALEGLAKAGKLSAADLKKTRRAAWDAFALFGMGANASSTGPSLSGVVGDSTIPPGV